MVGRKPTLLHSLSFQLMTRDGTYHMELSLPSSVSLLWHTAIDLHFAHCSKQISKLPAHAYDDLGGFPVSYEISTRMKLLVHGQEHELTLSLLDSIEDMAQEILNQHRLDGKHRITIEHTLFKEQHQLSADLLALYRKTERDNHRLQQQCILFEERCHRAEQHAEQLAGHLESIESMLPALQDQLTAAKPSHPLALLRPVPQPNTVAIVLAPQSPERLSSRERKDSDGGRRSRSSSPGYAMPTAASKQDNMVNKYEDMKRALFSATEALDRTKAELERQKMHSEQSAKALQMQKLSAENQQLRSLSVNMRTEVMAVHRQLQDIQATAQSTVQRFYQHSEPLRADVPEDEEEDLYSQLDAAELDLEALPDAQLTDMDNGWTARYQDILPVHGDARSMTMLKQAVQSLRWPALEERMLSVYYLHYQTSSKGGMSMTMFLRMMKDVSILAVDNERSTSPSKREEHLRLSYSELNMLFMAASRLTVDDLPTKPRAFRVSHNATLQPQNKDKSKDKAPAIFGNTCSVLSKKQFLSVMQAVADRLYSNLVRQAAGTDADCLNRSEQSRLKRTTWELMLVKILVPNAIHLDLLPWALVHMQQFLHCLQTDPTLASYLQTKLLLVMRIYRRYAVNTNAWGGVPLLEDQTPPPYQTRHESVLGYKELSKACRELGIVPYMLDEQQLYKLFHELCSYRPQDRGDFPSLLLPHSLMDGLHRAHTSACQEDGMLGWVHSQAQQALLGAQLAQMGFSSPKKTAQPAPVQAAQDEITVEIFIIFLGSVAVYVSPLLQFACLPALY